jgi:hypothetical protein
MRRSSGSLVRGLLPAAVLLALPALAGAQQSSTQPPPAQAQPTAAAASQPPVAAQTAAPTAQVQVPQKVPIFNRANQHLPDWLRVRGEFRERFEGFENSGFVEERDDSYALTRFRFNIAATANPWLSFQANLQDARVGGKTVGPTTAPFRGPFDVRVLMADVGSAKSPVAARLGRQELAFGEQRLLGHLAWVNTGRTWDAARMILRAKAFQVDVFGASLVRSLPDEFDKSGNGNRLAGAYATTAKLIPKGVFEPYVIFRRDVNLPSELGALGTINQTTMGARTAGRLPLGLDYGVEMAMQRGSLAADSIDAWAGHWQMRESLPGAAAVKLTSEYNFASGDKNPRDGTRSTFDQLYPTGHDKLGLSDQVGWRNTHHLREGVEFSPLKATPISLNYHTWWLAEKTDGLYAANGSRIAFVPGGAADAHVGQEIDVQVTRPLTPQLQLAGGYAHMFTGAFLEQATPGKSYSYPYIMATYVFLADK